MGTTGSPSGASTLRGRGKRKSLRRQSRDESGSIVVLVALFLTMFLLLAAVVVDVGYWWVTGKKAQIAADACALAAAQSIPLIDPTSPPVGTTDPLQGECVIEAYGPDYVFQNLPQEGTSEDPKWKGTRVEWPYEVSSGVFDETKVEATVRLSAGSFFGRIVGHNGVGITRRAVAERSLGTNEVTIHGHDTNCGNDNIKLNGLNITIGGILESNGKLIQDGASFQSGPATAGGPGGCLIDVDPGGDFGGQPSPTNDPTIHPWPAYFVPWEDGLTCDFTGTNLVFGDDEPENSILDDQIYCAHQSIEVTKPMSGKVTFIAPEIKINAERTDFAPSTKAMNAGKPLLFFALANGTTAQDDDDPDPYCQYNKEMKLNGFRAKWTGIIFNPCSRVVINGDENSAITSLVEGMSVEINGANFTINNFPFTGGPIELALDE